MIIKHGLFACTAILALLVIQNRISAATFEVLFPVDRAGGEKSVLVSDDGSTVLSTPAGGGEHDSYLWKKSQGIVATYPWWPTRTTGMSGDGKTILTETYPDPVFWEDASYDGSVRVGASGNLTIALFGNDFQTLAGLPSESYSGAWAVSSDGTTIVGDSTSSNGRVPFRWTAATGMVPLGTLPGETLTSGSGAGVSADGSAIVGNIASQYTPEGAFRWTVDKGMESLGPNPPRWLPKSCLRCVCRWQHRGRPSQRCLRLG